ncbi:HAD family phosphatase [Streptosporangiaceae bacterium NEAU-GS5]|nr:HAD family phosphatase [Streptosporangiaceae bacterium NEAU-GS5]
MFDLDGVLVDSEPVWEQVRRQVVAEFGGTWAPDAQSRLMGMSTAEWARYLSEDLGVELPPDQVAAMVVDRMAERYRERLPLLPGAAEAVRRMAGRWTVGIASASPPRLIDAVIEAASIGAYVTAAVSADQVERGKPAPDVYLAATERLSVAPEWSVAVEDSTNGLRSAAAAGLAVVAAPRPAYPPDPSALELARLVLSDLSDLTQDAVARLA